MKLAFLFSGLAILFAAGGLSAQDPKVPPRKLRLMAVGDEPPFRQEYRNGVRHEKDAAEGSIPPRQITVLTGDKSSEPMKLALREPTPPIEVPGTATQVNIVADGRAWLAVNLPEGGDFLAILLRDPPSGKWNKARSILIPEGTGKFDQGDVRFISLTAAALRFQINDAAAFEVPPGKPVTKKLGVTSGTKTLAEYRDPKQGWTRLWSSALVQHRDERSTVLVYPSDGIRPRRPLTLISLKESSNPAPAVAPPPPLPTTSNGQQPANTPPASPAQ